MKNKIIILGVLLVSVLSAGTLQAQYSHLYYHRTGDTIQYDSPIYYHNRWGFEDSYHSRGRTAVIMGGCCYAKENPHQILTLSSINLVLTISQKKSCFQDFFVYLQN